MVGRLVIGQENEDIDVGIGRELAAPVAADRNQRRRFRHRAGFPGASERFVGGAREGVHQAIDVGRALEALEQGRLGRLVGGFQRISAGRGVGGYAHGQAGRQVSG